MTHYVIRLRNGSTINIFSALLFSFINSIFAVDIKTTETMAAESHRSAEDDRLSWIPEENVMITQTVPDHLRINKFLDGVCEKMSNMP